MFTDSKILNDVRTCNRIVSKKMSAAAKANVQKLILDSTQLLGYSRNSWKQFTLL